MALPSPVSSLLRAVLVVLIGLAPLLVEAAAVKHSAVHDRSTEPTTLERFLDDIFGRSEPDAESMSTVQATAPLWTAYLRIASLSIALYDYITTIPAEWRLYMAQPSFTKMSRACVLFFAVRYMSVAALVTSNVGFFGSGFSANVCKHYQLVAPLTKLFACLLSQIIVATRTYAISRKESWVKWTLTALFFASMVPEFMGNVYKRRPVQNRKGGNCTSGNLPDAKIAWIHYLAAMVFDAVVTAISTFYLTMYSPGISLMSNLSRLMLKEGIVYFIFLTAVNILNLVMFHTSSIAAQSSAACLGQAVTMIMSQRVILALYEWRTTSAPSRGNTRPELYELSNGKRGTLGPHAIGPSMGSGVNLTDVATASTPSTDHIPSPLPPFKAAFPPRATFAPNVRGAGSIGAKNVVHVHVEQETKDDCESVYPPSLGHHHFSYDNVVRHEKRWTPL